MTSIQPISYANAVTPKVMKRNNQVSFSSNPQKTAEPQEKQNRALELTMLAGFLACISGHFMNSAKLKEIAETLGKIELNSMRIR